MEGVKKHLEDAKYRGRENEVELKRAKDRCLELKDVAELEGEKA